MKKNTILQVIELIFLLVILVMFVAFLVTVYIFRFEPDEDFISIVQKSRLYAVSNREGATYDRYGIEINSDSVVLFADAGMPYDFDESVDLVIETVKPPWFHEFEFMDGELPVYLYFENGSGELTSYETIGTDLVLMEKAIVKRLDFRITNGKDSNKYIYIFQLSGIAEESDTPFL